MRARSAIVGAHVLISIVGYRQVWDGTNHQTFLHHLSCLQTWFSRMKIVPSLAVVGDSDMRILAQFLWSQPTLTHLDLSWNSFDDKQCKQLSLLAQLRHLDLSGLSLLTDLGLKDAVKGPKPLETLILNNTVFFAVLLGSSVCRM